MKDFDFMNLGQTIVLLKYNAEVCFQRECLMLDTSHELLFFVEAVSFNSG